MFYQFFDTLFPVGIIFFGSGLGITYDKVGQRETDPSKRVCILTRSAFAGEQKNASIIWSGDISGEWGVLRASIPAGLGFALSGMPYWTTDIGGFWVKYTGGNKNNAYRELFTRWYQFGAFCPVFRVHGSSTPREI
ncbi:MAG: TIM-barrel domain-containing protein [Chitinophagaceae bacterium]